MLENKIVTIDLKTDGYPLFDHHHSANLHESPISYYEYLVEPDIKILQHILVSKEMQSKSTNAECPLTSQLVSNKVDLLNLSFLKFNKMITFLAIPNQWWNKRM